MEPGLERLLRREMSRSARIILSFKDRHCDQHLPGDVSDELRRTVLDELNRFAAVASFIADAAVDGAPINELAIPYISHAGYHNGTD